ncbi:MAG: alpha-L-fucosidase [Phycisphaeraceae bacterium JB051]
MMKQQFGDGRDWFLEHRFGLFVHWGPYAMPGWHEQIQQRMGIKREDYERQIARFDPVDFDPEPWLDMMLQAGMTYIVITTKHHDGFCMWDSKLTDFKVTRNGGPDTLKTLADACHARGIKLGLYYSVVDWKHPAYPNEGRHHELPPQDGDTPDAKVYLAYLKEQIRELCTGYGDVRYIWWDMNVPQWEDESIHAMIRELQPSCVINDRGFHDRDAVDHWQEGIIATRERDYNPALGETDEVIKLPTESCDSLDALSWGYKTDADYYSLAYLKRNIAQNMARGNHYLLNVGPDTQGMIPSQQVDMLKQIGDWYAKIKACFTDTHLVTGMIAQPGISLMQANQPTADGEYEYYVIATEPLNCRGLQLRPIDTPPLWVKLLNTGEYMQWARDIVPNDVTHPYLRIREIPVDELAGDVLVFKMLFAKPLEVSAQMNSVEKI